MTIKASSPTAFDPSNPRVLGIVAKMDRALEHVKQLDAWYDGWVAEKPWSIETVYNRQGGVERVDFRLTDPVPILTGVIIGDIVHNLRCALDHLAGAVAIKAGKTTKGVYFPVAPSAADLTDALKEKLRKCPQAFRDFVKDKHPYKGGNNTLYAIHHLDILDKHQVLIPTGVGAEVYVSADNGLYGAIDFSKTTQPVRIPMPKGRGFIKDGETAVRFDTHAFWFPEKTRVETRVPLSIVFGDDTPVPDTEVRSALSEMIDCVQTIVHEAEPQFLR